MRVLRYALVVTLAVGLLGFAWPAPGAEPATVRVGQIPIASALPFFVALEKKFFDDEGLRIEMQFLEGGAKIIPAIAGGSLDIGFSNYISAFLAREQGFDIVIVAPQSRNGVTETPSGLVDISPVLALADSGITAPADLKGKRVAVNTLRNVNDLYAYEWLSRHGLNPRTDVTWVEIPFPKMGSVLRSKQVDAVFVTEPGATVEKERGGVRVLGHPYIAVAGRLEVAGYVTTHGWAEKNPGVLERFVRAYYRGIDYTNAHRDEWAPILGKHTRLPPGVITKMLHSGWGHPIDVASLQTSADLALKWGLLKRPLDVRSIVHPLALK